MKKIILTGLGLGLLIGIASSAQATITGFQFSGTWDSVDNNLIHWFTKGDNFQATIRYDTDKTADSSDAGGGGTMSKYNNNYFTLSTNDWSATDQAAEIKIYNDYNTKDQFVIWFNPPSDGKLKFPAGMPEFDNGFFNLTNDDATVFTNDRLPSGIASIGATPFDHLIFNLNFGTNHKWVTGAVNSITPLPTSEPSTYILLATGLAVLAGLRKIKKSQLDYKKQAGIITIFFVYFRVLSWLSKIKQLHIKYQSRIGRNCISCPSGPIS